MTKRNCLRNVVCYCPVCDRETDVLCREDDRIRCPWCEIEMEQHWWKRRTQQATVWDKSEWATVFKKPDGSFSFPARADKPTPEGCERITIRSDAEMARVERESGTRNERRWFDRGSAGGFDTQDLPALPFRMR
jgi:hypothetical protein